MKDNNMDEIEIDLKELFFALLNKTWLIVLVMLVSTLVAFLITRFMMTPYYVADTKVYVLSRQGENNLTYQDLQIGSQLTKDYKELIISRPVLEEVIESLKLNLDYSKLKEMISVDIPSDTRIISISIKAQSPQLAMDIANEIRESSSKQIAKVMDIEAVNIVEEARLPLVPAGPSLPKNMLIGAMFGAVLVLGILVFVYMLDDTIKTPEDIEKFLNLSTLGTIPMANLNEGKVKKKRERQILKSERKERKKVRRRIRREGSESTA